MNVVAQADQQPPMIRLEPSTAPLSGPRALGAYILAFCGFFLAGWAYYHRVLPAWFTADEVWIIANVQPREWWQIFTVWDVHPKNFVPGLLLSLKLDHMAFGWDATFFRVHSLADAALMATLVTALLRPRCGWAISILTGLLLMESNPTVSLVGWIASRHYLEGTCFALIGILLLRRYERTASSIPLIGAMACYAIAMLYKEVFAPLPLVLLALPDVPMRRRIRLLALFGLVGGSYIAYRRYMLGQFVGGYGDGNYNLMQAAEYFANAWPSFSGWILEGPSSVPRWLGFFVVNALIVMGLYRAWSISWRWFAAALLSLIAAVVPVGLIIGTPQVNYLKIANHYCMRFAFPLWIVTLIWAAFAWAALNRRFAAACLIAICAVAANGAWYQHHAWKHDGLVTKHADEVFRNYAWQNAVIAIYSPGQQHEALKRILPWEQPEKGPVTAFVISGDPAPSISRDDSRLADPDLIFVENPRFNSSGKLAKVANILTREQFLERYAFPMQPTTQAEGLRP